MVMFNIYFLINSFIVQSRDQINLVTLICCCIYYYFVTLKKERKVGFRSTFFRDLRPEELRDELLSCSSSWPNEPRTVRDILFLSVSFFLFLFHVFSSAISSLFGFGYVSWPMCVCVIKDRIGCGAAPVYGSIFFLSF